MSRILYLDHAPILGGAQVVLLNLVDAIDRERWTPMVASGDHEAFLAALAARSVETVVVPFGRLAGAGAAMPFNLVNAARAVRRIVRLRHVDLIHSNTVRTHIVGSLAARMAGIPIVWTLHDDTFPPHLLRLLAPAPSRVIAVSRWLGERYGPLGLAKKLRVVPNGLPSDAPPASGPALREELGVAADAPLVVNVGRLVEGKAPHLFVEAAQRIHREFPAARFALVGGPDPVEPGRRPPAYLDRLARILSETPLGGRLLVPGHRDDAHRFFAAADVVVYNPVVPEGFGLVLLEAARAGAPVVASAIGAAREIVQDGSTGLLVPAGDPAALAAAVLSLLRDPARAAALGRRGRERFLGEFTLRAQLERTEEVYREVLASG